MHGNFLQQCPGASLGNDQRQSQGKEYFEYWVALLPQKEVQHRAYLPWDDKVGLFVRHDDEWNWLRSLLTIPKIKELLDQEYHGGGVERFEMPGIRAVHFLLVDHLDRGFNACSTYDTLGKNVCEYLRAKHVDLPTKFLRRGII